MSERRLALILVFALLPGIARAQDTRADLARLRELRERVRALDAQRTNQRNEERAVTASHLIGRLHQSGSIRLAGHGADSVLAPAVAGAAALLTEFAIIPDDFTRTTLLVQSDLANRDELIASAEGVSRIVDVDVARLRVASDAVWPLASAVARPYRAQLNTEWRDWLPEDLAVVWIPAREGVGAMTALTEGTMALGRACLAGELSSCARWLGLDDAMDPFATRYAANDLRRSIRHVTAVNVDPDYPTCLAGNDPACVRVARRYPNLIAEIVPAPLIARASVLRAVSDRYGTDALKRALADSTGSRGERLSRATGASLDSIVSHWRLFVLRRGHVDRVEAGWPHVLTAVLTAGLLAALAARSGRWR